MKPKTTTCPAPIYREYRPNPAMLAAQARAAKDQPPLIALASKVPNYRVGE